jgi:Asp-tRNA(Asn)/Glu-tRNA(Gln) amidotransferase A subunit family amidase
MLDQYESLTAVEIVVAVKSKKLSAVDIAQKVIALSESGGKEDNAALSICHEKAVKQALRVDEFVSGGEDASR